MDNLGKSSQKKKPYVAPKVTKVDLSPEEVVLGACKASSGTAGSKSPSSPCVLCGGSLGS